MPFRICIFEMTIAGDDWNVSWCFVIGVLDWIEISKRGCFSHASFSGNERLHLPLELSTRLPYWYECSYLNKGIRAKSGSAQLTHSLAR